MTKEDYSKYYIQGSDHYLIPKDIFNELFDEMGNWREEAKELKKQHEEWNHHLKCSKEMLDIQGHNGNYNYDSYMLGIYNGMEYIIALFETREPIFKSGKDIEFISELQQENQKLKKQLEEKQNPLKGIFAQVTDDQLLRENGLLYAENKKYKEVIDKAIKCIYYSTKYRNSADIYQFVDIESEILEPLKFILELNEENGNAYLKEFNDWLKECNK